MFCKKFILLLITLILASTTSAFAQVQKVKVAITGPANLVPGSTITYTVTVTNVSNTTVTGVWIYHHFDTGNQALTFLPNQSPDCVVTPNDPTWVICPVNKDTILTPGQSKQYLIRYLVPDNIPCNSTVVAVADVRGNGTDPHWSSLLLRTYCPVTPAILPTLSCVYNLGNGVYRAFYGYQNTGADAVTIASGVATQYESNYFTPGNAVRGQPSTFAPGTKNGAFFVDFNGNQITWVLKPRFGDLKLISASKDSKACFPIKPIAECRNLKPNNQYLTYFGYQNDNPFPITLNIADQNKFSPAPENRGQTTTFLTGRVPNSFSVLGEANLTWTLGSLSAAANVNTPQCVPDLGPTCRISASSNNNCGTSQATVSLDGSQSSDPEGLPLNYHWTTDCVDSSFTTITGSKPTLFVNTKGQAVNCSVKLTVNDGINNSIPCNYNLSVNTCQVDCAGKPNGTAALDRCGVCEGDGKSCLDCSDIDTTDTKFSLDIGAAQQKHLVTKLANRLKNLSKGDIKYKTLIDKSVEQAQKAYLSAWQVAWTTFPTIISSCTNAQFCQQTDYSTALDSYSSSSLTLKKLGTKLAKQISKIRRSTDIKGINGDKKLSLQVNDLHAKNSALIATVPRFSSQCN